ncbi:Formate--tetrahydrofolate ligase [Leminorella grimontii]|nr:Formate--tetrahydrofolate ligase [Leminorella grimontii]
MDYLREFALSCGAVGVEVSRAFAEGGQGTAELAKAVVAASQNEAKVNLLYQDEVPLRSKLQTLVDTYGADSLILTEQAEAQLAALEKQDFGRLPLCIAKTPLSISADPSLKNVPQGFSVTISSLKVSAGAGFIRAYAGNIMTMPGLGTLPAYRNIDLDDNGEIVGLS